MNILKEKLFANDVKWLAQAYGSLQVAITVEKYFLSYFKSRQDLGEEIGFYLESVDVQFCAPEEIPHMSLKLAFATKTLLIQIPDWNYSEAQKQNIREQHLQKYAIILKESQVRANVLLWKTFSAEEQESILALQK